MLTIKDWMELVDYKITKGGIYNWDCFGPDAYYLDSWNQKHVDSGWSMSISFDLRTQTVYDVTVCDYKRNRAYKLVNADYEAAYRKQLASAQDKAWIDGDYTLLETDEDFLEKAQAIMADKDYDTHVILPLDLPDDVILKAALEAHRQGITLNDYINKALVDIVQEYNRDPEGVKDLANAWKNKSDIT
jgi:hypothetical protein